MKTAEPIRLNASFASISQLGVVSQLVKAYVRGEHMNRNNIWLAASG
jgi:hypothetical protein